MIPEDFIERLKQSLDIESVEGDESIVASETSSSITSPAKPVSTDLGESGFPWLIIPIIVVVLAGGGIATFLIIKKSK